MSHFPHTKNGNCPGLYHSTLSMARKFGFILQTWPLPRSNSLPVSKCLCVARRPRFSMLLRTEDLPRLRWRLLGSYYRGATLSGIKCEIHLNSNFDRQRLEKLHKPSQSVVSDHIPRQYFRHSHAYFQPEEKCGAIFSRRNLLGVNTRAACYNN